MAKTRKKREGWKDRRHYQRRHVLWAGRLRSGAGEQQCVILDLSAAGAMVRLSDGSSNSARVAVSGDWFGELLGRVIWQQDNVIGLRFAARPQQVASAVGESLSGLRLAS